MEISIFDEFIDNTYNNDEELRKWDNYYDLNRIKDKFKVIPVGEGFMVWIDREGWINFFVFETVSWDGDTLKPSNIKIIWHGEGPSDTLRELRHSYFSPYLFYINAKVIEASFQELRKHFDI